MKNVAAQDVLDNIEGATIVSSYVDEEEGMHLCLADGRVLVIAGVFALGLVRLSTEMLH